jgi:opacity protein-like surface antigen
MLLTVARSERTAPYVAIGGGLYRARFDLGDARFLGGMGSQFAAGTRFVPVRGMSGFGMMNSGMTFNGNIWTDAWTGPRFTASRMPMFYANRLGQMTVPSDGRWGMRSFTDPALTVGGGIRINVTDRLYVRPDVRALVVFGTGERLVLTNMVVGVGYRF